MGIKNAGNVYDLTGGHPGEQLYGARAGLGTDRSPGQSPQLLGEPPVLRYQGRPLAGESGTHVAHLAAAHRVGLAGQ